MTLQHDSDGFLIGDPIDLQRAVSLLGSIQSDVRAMRQALAGSSGSSPQVPTRTSRAQATPVAPVRSSTPAVQAEISAAVNRQMSAMVKAAKPDSRTVAPSNLAATRIRDGRGRFIGRSGEVGSQSARASGGVDGGSSLLMSSDGFAQRVASAVTEGISNSEEADPTFKAFNEVAEPLKRGYKTMFGDAEENRQSTWFGRLWDELKGIRTDQTTYEKATVKSLKAIEEKPESSESSGGIFGSIMASLIRFAPLVAQVIAGLAALGVGLAAIKKIIDFFTPDSERDKKSIDGLQKNIADPAKEALKKVGIDKDAEIAAIREKNRREQNGTDEYERMDRARAAVAAEGLKPWSSDYEAKLSSVYQGLEQQDAEAKKGPLRKAWEKSKSWFLGQTSKTFESGKGGAGTVSSGKGDAGGASYGTYQLSSKAGTLDKFLGGSKYGAEFAGLQPGTPEFKAKWKEIAAADPDFGAAQHDFIKATHFDPQMAKLQKSGIDLSGRGAAVQDAVWSTAVQFGPNSSLIQKALKGKEVANLSDKDIVSTIQDYKTTNNDALFKSSSVETRTGTLKRATDEKLRLIALADSASAFQAASIKPPQVVTSPLPTMPAMPAPPQIPDAPQIHVPLSSDDAGRNITVTPPANEPGQDLSNRRIAHVVTGGYSSA